MSPHPCGSDAGISLPDNANGSGALTDMSGPLYTQDFREYHFHDKFRSLTVEEVINPSKELRSDPEFVDLQKAVLLMKRRMDQMNRLGKAIPNDPVESLLYCMTRKSSVVHLLVEHDRRDPEKEMVAGFQLVITEEEDFPDLESIPPELRDGKPLARALRLAIDQGCGTFQEHEQSSAIFVDALLRVTEGKRVIAKVLKGQLHDGDLPGDWCAARPSLEAKGFEDTGFAHIESFTHSDGTEISLRFGWYMYPPESEKYQKVFEAHKERVEKLDQKTLQRLALIGAHVPPVGAEILVCSRGAYGHDIAAAFPMDFVIEVLPADHYRAKPGAERLRNLQIIKDVALGVSSLPKASLDLVYDSSVLGQCALRGDCSQREAVEEMLGAHAELLKDRGVYILRNPAAPDEEIDGEIRLSVDDGEETGSYRQLSTAARFRLFLEKLDLKDRVTEGASPVGNFASFRGSNRILACFLDALETDGASKGFIDAVHPDKLLHREDFEEIFRKHGLRTISSSPECIGNGNVRFLDNSGLELPLPMTHCRIVGQRVPPDEGIELAQVESHVITEPTFLQRTFFQHEDGSLREIVEHRLDTLDVLPFFVSGGRLFVIPEMGHPRPVTNEGTPSLDGTKSNGYVTEVIAHVGRNKDGSLSLPERIAYTLHEKAEIEVDPDTIVDPVPRMYFTAPRDSNDIVHALAVEIPPVVERKNPRYPGLKSRPTVQPAEMHKMLLACEKGGATSDARLERILYELGISRGIDFGRWIGEKLSLEPQSGEGFAPDDPYKIFHPHVQRLYQRIFNGYSNKEPSALYEIVSGTFVERNAEGKEVNEQPLVLEYARRTPSLHTSTNSAVILPIMKIQQPDGPEEIYVGFALRESPVAQETLGNAILTSVPTFDLPVSVKTFELGDYVSATLKGRYDLEIEPDSVVPLGESYFSSDRFWANRVYPCVAEVNVEAAVKSTRIRWVKLTDALANVGELYDGNAITLVYRTAHALGLLNKEQS